MGGLGNLALAGPMNRPTLLGGTLLVYLLVLLPWLAYRSALHLRAARADGSGSDGTPLPPLAQILASSLFFMALLFCLSWLTGGAYEYPPFWYRAIGPLEIGSGLLAFAACFGLRLLSRAIRTEEERRAMAVRQLIPRTTPEWALYLGLGIAAGITEEYAYRGVGMWALSLWIGNAWAAALVMAVAFGLAHITQEWKSAGIATAMALLMHGLVALTDTLVVAMVVHITYDWVAAVILRREMAAEARG
jgi:membrane protease YdiL (CAAX protease family)